MFSQNCNKIGHAVIVLNVENYKAVINYEF